MAVGEAEGRIVPRSVEDGGVVGPALGIETGDCVLGMLNHLTLSK